MTARPMTLEDALHRQGYTIETAAEAALTITIPSVGNIVVPAEVRSSLVWQRGTPPTGVDPTPGDDLWLSSLPLFAEEYRPVILSNILDRFRTRRLGYNTPGEFRLAVRRWGNLHMTMFNQRYASTAVVMPLDDTAATDHKLDVASDFPQSQISGSTDYSTTALDSRAAANGRHRPIAELLMEQRLAYLNVDEEVVDAMESLFLGAFDQPESDVPDDYAPPQGRSGLSGFWNGQTWPRW